jgi:hypothetical protein
MMMMMMRDIHESELLTILFMPGITAMLASTVEHCSLLLPLRWGAERDVAMA